MTHSSLMRTVPAAYRALGYRKHKEDWPDLHLDMASGEGTMGGVEREIKVAVVDSGVPDGPSTRPDSARGGAGTPDGTDIDGKDRDDEGHATLLAGTIRRRGNDASERIHIRATKFFSAQGWPRAEHGAAAIGRAAAIEPPVIVLAWDACHTTAALEKAIWAVRDTAVVVIAAGNWSLDNDKHFNWPANYGDMAHVLTVMATDEQDERASYSSYGQFSVYIAAPGLARSVAAPSSSALRTAGSLRSHYDGEFRGTSAAAAHVARLAALVRAKHPELTPQLVKEHIGNTARPVVALKRLCKTGAIVDFGKALK